MATGTTITIGIIATMDIGVRAGIDTGQVTIITGTNATATTTIDAVVMAAMTMEEMAAGQTIANVTTISTGIVRKGPGSPIPVITGHATETAIPNGQITPWHAPIGNRITPV